MSAVWRPMRNDSCKTTSAALEARLNRISTHEANLEATLGRIETVAREVGRIPWQTWQPQRIRLASKHRLKMFEVEESNAEVLSVLLAALRTKGDGITSTQILQIL